MYDKVNSDSAPWCEASGMRWSDQHVARMQDEAKHDQEAMAEFKATHDGMTPEQYALWAFPCSD